MRILFQNGLTALAVSLLSACSEPPEEREPFEFVEATIADIQGAITSGKMTCEAIVSGYLARIEKFDQSTGLNAITEINPTALTRAREIDTALSEWEEVGPLFCAPLLVKDNFDTFDMPTTGGSIALKGSIPPDDAFRNGAVDVKHLYHTISRRDTVDGSRERVLSASLYTGGKPGF